jgi:hypothetical protein
LKLDQKNGFSGFCQKFPQAMDEVENFLLANFQILGPLGCQGWVVIPQNVKKSQNHCTLISTLWGGWVFVDIRIVKSYVMNWD